MSSAERTLYHLAAAEEAHEALPEEPDAEEPGPEDSSWGDLLAAIMDGFERGWVARAVLEREGSETSLVWCATPTGERALRAYRVRQAKRPKPKPKPKPRPKGGY